LKITHVETIVFVSDIARSTAFYRGVLGQPIAHDYGQILMFEHGFSIHDGPDLLEKTYKTPGAFPKDPQGKDNLEIHFETDDLEGALGVVVKSGAEVIHPIEVQPWGQPVSRFHDPDGHNVEIEDSHLAAGPREH
jgi:catechol 2,3-dioxygenase-like lactoylglutathione lyase family enzyme